jgi:hypothetical protein
MLDFTQGKPHDDFCEHPFSAAELDFVTLSAQKKAKETSWLRDKISRKNQRERKRASKRNERRKKRSKNRSNATVFHANRHFARSCHQ